MRVTSNGTRTEQDAMLERWMHLSKRSNQWAFTGFVPLGGGTGAAFATLLYAMGAGPWASLAILTMLIAALMGLMLLGKEVPEWMDWDEKGVLATWIAGPILGGGSLATYVLHSLIEVEEITKVMGGAVVLAWGIGAACVVVSHILDPWGETRDLGTKEKSVKGERTMDTSFHLHRVDIGGFRNLSNMRVDLEPDLTLITGEQGSGKTALILSLVEGMRSWWSEALRFGGGRKDRPKAARTRGQPEPEPGAIDIKWRAMMEGKKITWRWADLGREDGQGDGYRSKEVEKTTTKRWKEGRRPIVGIWVREDRGGGEHGPDRQDTLATLSQDHEGEILSLILALIARADPRIADTWKEGRKGGWKPYFEYETGEVVRLDELSHGERSWLEILSKIGAVAAQHSRMDGLDAFEQVEGLALVDHLEQNMSRARQEIALGVMRDAFPKLQLVVTTHAERVNASAGPEQIRDMDEIRREGIKQQDGRTQLRREM